MTGIPIDAISNNDHTIARLIRFNMEHILLHHVEVRKLSCERFKFSLRPLNDLLKLGVVRSRTRRGQIT
jgi:hypothetical protein